MVKQAILYFKYQDVYNLYEWAISQKLPVYGLMWGKKNIPI